MKEVEGIFPSQRTGTGYKKVQANGGAPGIDGMKASEAVKYIQANKEKIAGEIIARKYKP